MTKKLLILAFSLIALAASFSPAAVNQGAEQMVLYGGSQGKVPFPHLRHQNNLGDCQICHKLFPQENGSIEKLKAEGRLKNKQVMNTLCVKCHRDERRAGNTAGPTLCSKCHQRE